MPINFERSNDTEAAVIALRGVNIEGSYEMMARQTGLSVRRLKSVLPSARRILENEGIVFGAIIGIGLKRLSDTDKVKQPESLKKRMAKAAGRGIKRLSTIHDFGALSKTDQHSVTTNRTILNIIRQQARVKPEPPKPTTAPQPMADVTKLIPKKAG